MPFIEAGSGEWEKCIKHCRFDVYQLPAYCMLEAEVLHGKAVAWISGHKAAPVLIPLVERDVVCGSQIFHDLSSPYGYPGILYSREMPSADLHAAMIQYNHEASAGHYISSFIRLHPFLNPNSLRPVENCVIESHGATIAIDLNDSLESIRDRFSQNHKRNLKSLNRNNFFAQVNNWHSLDDFIRLYHETMRRKNAGKRYFFPRDYFTGLKSINGTNVLLITVHNSAGRIAAGGIFTVTKGLAQFHLGGTASEFLDQSPSKLMIDAAVVATKKLGAEVLHLGGGYGSDNADGLFRFKAGFGMQQQDFRTIRMIHDKDKYNMLLSRTHTSKSVVSNNYFPAYRKPV